MAPTRDWSVEETGSLVTDLSLLRSPAEIASALGRKEEDVKERMAQLGLSSAPAAPIKRSTKSSK